MYGGIKNGVVVFGWNGENRGSSQVDMGGVIRRFRDVVIAGKAGPRTLAFLWFLYLSLVFTLIATQVFHLRLGKRCFAFVAIGLTAFVGLGALEIGLDETIIELFEWLPTDTYNLRIGPFYQALYGYDLLCGVGNWLLVFALAVFIRLGRKKV